MGDKCNRDNNWCRTFYWDRGGAKWPRFGTTPHKFLTKIHSKCKADSWVYPQGVREWGEWSENPKNNKWGGTTYNWVSTDIDVFKQVSDDSASASTCAASNAKSATTKAKQDLTYGLDWISVGTLPPAGGILVQRDDTLDKATEALMGSNPLETALLKQESFSMQEWNAMFPKDTRPADIFFGSQNPFTRYSYIKIGTKYFQPRSLGLAWERVMERPLCDEETNIGRLQDELRKKIQDDVDQAIGASLSGSLLTKAYVISAAPYGGAISGWDANKTFIDVRVLRQVRDVDKRLLEVHEP